VLDRSSACYHRRALRRAHVVVNRKAAAAEVPSVELVVPRLVPALSQPAAAYALHGLQRFLARAHLRRSACDSIEQALCERFSVARQEDWPIAALTLLADGIDPADGYWLRADPAHLHAARGELILTACGRLGQTQPEADALVASLNQHFAPESLQFHAVRPYRWYVRAAQAQDLVTIPPSAALGHNVDRLLPLGEHALAWHRRLNEMQMLLHEHPVNTAREARGAVPVNSVWLWGGGRRPQCRSSAGLTAWSDEPLVRGLALCAGAPCKPTPPSADAWLRAAGAGDHLIVLSDPLNEHASWASELERHWMAPLLAAIRRGAVERAMLVTHHGRELVRLAATRLDLWKFWRRAPRIDALALAAAGPDA
jgi:hypothetical protein